MKAKLLNVIGSFTIFFLLMACSEETGLSSAGSGRLSLQVAIGSDGNSRAMTTHELENSCSTKIYNTEGLIRQYTGLSSLPGALWLVSGNYRVDVEAGETVSASFEKKSYSGSQPFTIQAGRQTNVSVSCPIRNTVVAVSFDPTVADAVRDYRVKIAIDRNDEKTALTFDLSNSSSLGYYTMPEGTTELMWEFSGTDIRTGTAFVKSGVITAVTASKKYTLKFRYTPGEESGSLMFDITIDKTTEDVEDIIEFVADPTGALAVEPLDVWAGHSTVWANVDEGEFGTDGIQFQYREQLLGSENEWRDVDASRNETNRFSADLTGLKPETNYEYRLIVNQEPLGQIQTFTTDVAPGLPNASLDIWSKAENSKYESPFSTETEKWWDTGNAGSTYMNMGDPIAVPDEDVPAGSAGGAKSAKLSSKWVVVKLAAGNLFAGEFGSVDMASMGGTVKFGRPFTGRPTHFTGRFKYTCGEIDKYKDNPEGITSGKDRCHIFIALGDWDYKKFGGNASCPILVNTADVSTLFDKDGDAVIAYGELVKQETVSDWTSFSIPLVYKDTKRRPTHIVIVSSSSKLGDYFTGSTQSVLWVDDFGLEYR